MKRGTHPSTSLLLMETSVHKINKEIKNKIEKGYTHPSTSLLLNRNFGT
jgi:zona occludens toxin (predicted ATPase)